LQYGGHTSPSYTSATPLAAIVTEFSASFSQWARC
jgi:hypothetical protein